MGGPNTFHVRALVQNGNCEALYTPVKTVQVNACDGTGGNTGNNCTVTGTITANATEVCGGPGSFPSGFFNLSGHQGKVKQWEWSLDNSNWITLVVGNLTSNTPIEMGGPNTFHVRALVQNDNCEALYTPVKTVQVNACDGTGGNTGNNCTVTGTITANATEVCGGPGSFPSGFFNLSGHQGKVKQWEWSLDNSNWITLVVGNLTSNTPVEVGGPNTFHVRALVQKDNCEALYTPVKTVQVNACDGSDGGSAPCTVSELQPLISIDGNGLESTNAVSVCEGQSVKLNVVGGYNSNWTFTYNSPDGQWNGNGTTQGFPKDELLLEYPSLGNNTPFEGTWTLNYTDPNGCIGSTLFHIEVLPDSDNDGICDAEDQCPGFDDNLDLDNDNIPDGCDDCTVTGTITANAPEVCGGPGSFPSGFFNLSGHQGKVKQWEWSLDNSNWIILVIGNFTSNTPVEVGGPNTFHVRALVQKDNCEALYTPVKTVQVNACNGSDGGSAPCTVSELQPLISIDGNGLESTNAVSVCEGQSVKLNVVGGYNSNWTFTYNSPDGQWNGNGTTQGFPKDELLLEYPSLGNNTPFEGTWTLNYTDPNGCIGSTLFHIEVLPDSDNDGICDANDTTVGNCTLGGSCNDGDACTTGDVYDTNCNCAGVFQDSDNDGICDANDTTVGNCTLGGSCNDGDACTTGDVYDTNCNCAGVFQDSDNDGICDANDTTVGNCTLGGSCNDGDACTTGDVYDTNCNCVGVFQDSDNDGICDANDITVGNCTIGGSCNDGNACTTGDVYDTNCNCVGVFQDSDNDGICDAEQEEGVTSTSYCNITSANNSYEYIQQVKIGTVDNTSAASSTGYEDFTDQVIDLSVGMEHPITLTPGFTNASYDEFWQVWIDINRNGNFEESEELLLADQSKSTITGLISIPNTAMLGMTRMRITMQWKGHVATACTNPVYGEVEDYTINLLAASDCEDTDGDAICDAMDPCPLDVNNNCNNDYCDLASNSTKYEYIDQVIIGDISNLSENNNGYGDYKNIVTNLEIGISNPIQLIPHFATRPYTEHWAVWIDLNQDGVFSQTDELVFTAASDSMVNGQFTLPRTTKIGSTRMRIAMQWNKPIISSCGEILYGEVEDYTVNVQSAALQSTIFTKNKKGNPTPVKIELFPNPVKDLLNIDVSESLFSKILIYNMSGQKVYQQNIESPISHLSIPLDHLRPGLYTSIVTTVEGEVFVEKFIKNDR